jgi:hypothetical protein
MAMALIYPEPEKGGRGHKRLGGLSLSSSKERLAFAERLSVARSVLRWGRDDVAGLLVSAAGHADVGRHLVAGAFLTLAIGD